MKKLFVILALFISVSALPEDPPCQGDYPTPTWILTVTLTHEAADEKAAKIGLEEKLSERINHERKVCIANDGEAYWYRPKEVTCKSLKNGVLCSQVCELECEAVDI